MRWSPEKLRWVLLVGAVLLAGVLAALLGLAKYRAGKIWQRILARNGVNLVRETNGFTYSQSDGKRTVFTLHAARAVPHGTDNWTLHDAVLILYARDGHTDRIYGSQFQYDQKQGVARAVGEVHMDLEAPQAAGARERQGLRPDLSFKAGDEESADPALIHVRTSGLVYVRKLGVAATDQPVEFRYEEIQCTSRGAEFDSGQSTLRLLAEVHMTGTLRDAPFTLTAAHADLNRSADTADLAQPVLVSGQRSARAAHVLLHLHKDGSLESGEADGNVDLREATQRVTAMHLQAVFAAQNRPQHARLSGGVGFTDTNPNRTARGSAQAADFDLNQAGLLRTAVAEGGVSASLRLPGTSGTAATRQMQAQRATASFVPVGTDGKRSLLHVLQMTGAAEFTGTAAGTKAGQGSTSTRVLADDLTTIFAANSAAGLETKGDRSVQPQRMSGTGHTELQQNGADGAHETSTGDALDVLFAERAGSGAQVASAVQTGDVVVHSWPAAAVKGAVAVAPAPSTGRAQKAMFEAAAGTLTLSGTGGSRAVVDNGETQLQAPEIVLHQGTGDAEANGGVAATTGGGDGAAATHVVAARAMLLHTSQMATFFGTDAQPAQLWQSGSQVRAAKIVLDGAHRTLAARPESPAGYVNAVFATARTGAATVAPAAASSAEAGGRTGSRSLLPNGGKLPEASRDAVEVRAAAMDYNDAEHEAVFRGRLRLTGSAGEITGEHGAAFLSGTPADAAAGSKGTKRADADSGAKPLTGIGGRLERLVVIGDVRLHQPGRTGTGEQLTYTAASNDFVLTGTPSAPPRVDDAQQGMVTGATLLFGAADSSIVVAGMPAKSKGAKPSRIHTETDLKPQ